MGLLMADTVLIDPLLDEMLRLRDDLGAWAFAVEGTRDYPEHEAADPDRVKRPHAGPVSLPTDGEHGSLVGGTTALTWHEDVPRVAGTTPGRQRAGGPLWRCACVAQSLPSCLSWPSPRRP
jgi:hypothetical protein